MFQEKWNIVFGVQCRIFQDKWDIALGEIPEEI
jgi:hypothetical protein